MTWIIGRFTGLGIVPHLIVATTSLIAIAILASTSLSIRTANSELYAQAQTRLDANMRVAWDQLMAMGAPRIEGDKLKFGDRTANGDQAIVDKIKTLVGGTATIFMGDTRVATNVSNKDGSRAVGTKLAPGPVHDAIFKDHHPYRGQAEIAGTPYFTAYDPIENDKREVIGILYTGVRKADFQAVVDKLGWTNAIAGAVILLLSAGALLVTIRSILKPLGRLRDAMAKLSAGEVATPIPGTEKDDDIGLMAKEVESFRQAELAKENLEAEQAQKRADEQRRARAIETSITAFDKSVALNLGAFTSAAGELRATSQTMTATAEETSAQANTVAAAAEQASTNVRTVAAAAEELSSSVAEIGRQVGQSTKIAGEAVSEADRTNVSVRGLSTAAQKIGDVVKLINDIASQTNLLALNATIEAARAGEAGKGFAVVASEVKSLANQTAKATEEIAAQVTEMQSATSAAVQAIQGIGATIGSINEIATTIAAAVEEQGATTQEIARNIQEAAQGTGQVSSSIVTVNQAAGQTGTAAGKVRASAEALGSKAETLRDGIDRFIREIRAV